MPSPYPAYESLPAQVAAAIRQRIAAGAWVASLPGERALAEELRVSRKTVRKAIARLESEGVIESERRYGHRVAGGAAPQRSGPRLDSVGLLTTDPLERLRPYTALWVDGLRSLLFAEGLRLAQFTGSRFFSGHPERSLARLVTQNPQACWVLAHTNERIQRWFAEKEIPCVIAGSSHPAFRLANVDLDYFGLCRHAAGAMRRLGHQTGAFVTEESQRLGDLESEHGFLSGMSDGASGIVVRHNGTPDGAVRALGRLFGLAERPTAILVANPVFYLTAFSFLADRGLRVPQDVSLICRDEDDFLSYLRPSPARYAGSAQQQAKRLFQLVRQHAAGERSEARNVRIEPRFIPGSSLAARSGSSGCEAEAAAVRRS
jgi:DNA-binding LacI/PurR family transcriptional regulator